MHRYKLMAPIIHSIAFTKVFGDASCQEPHLGTDIAAPTEDKIGFHFSSHWNDRTLTFG